MQTSDIAPCQICGSNRWASRELRLREGVVVRCSHCEFVYLDGDRHHDREAPRYDFDHFEGGGYLADADIRTVVAEQLASIEWALGRGGTTPAALAGRGGLLEIGSARGHLLKAMADRWGFREACGVEASRQMAEWGRRAFGIDIRSSPLETADLPAGNFSLIVLMDVLEHVAQPADVLQRLMSLLRTGGWIILEVPSEVTLFRWLARGAYRVSGGRWSRPVESLYHPFHLSYFSPRSLEMLVARVGGAHVVRTTKEAHVTRLWAGRYRWPSRLVMRAVAGMDKLLGTQAKLLVAFQKPD